MKLVKFHLNGEAQEVPGDHLKDVFGSKIVAVEAAECRIVNSMRPDQSLIHSCGTALCCQLTDWRAEWASPRTPGRSLLGGLMRPWRRLMGAAFALLQ